MKPDDLILITGHKGMVGSAIYKKLIELGFKNILTYDFIDYTKSYEVKNIFESYPSLKYVFNCAAKVGGILENSENQINFFNVNFQINYNIINNCYDRNIKCLILGSSCIYPKLCQQPIFESDLLTGLLEETNEAYALAKIISLKLATWHNKYNKSNFLQLMPCSLYGINDKSSHFIPMVMKRMIEAKKNNTDLIVWGTGKVLREFMFVDDFADIAINMMNNVNSENFINIGHDEEFTIQEIVGMMKKIIGFDGKIKFDKSKPDGTLRKKLDITNMKKLGLFAKTNLKDGLRIMYDWMITNEAN